jgi:hypothetical protein
MPLETQAYSSKRLADDLVALLDLLDIQKAVRERNNTPVYSL